MIFSRRKHYLIKVLDNTIYQIKAKNELVFRLHNSFMGHLKKRNRSYVGLNQQHDPKMLTGSNN
jgi:hypothetical protein